MVNVTSLFYFNFSKDTFKTLKYMYRKSKYWRQREGFVPFSKRPSFVFLSNFSQQYNSFLCRLCRHFLIMRYGKRMHLLCSPIFICIAMALPKPCGSNRAQGPAHLNPLVYFYMILLNFFFLFSGKKFSTMVELYDNCDLAN